MTTSHFPPAAAEGPAVPPAPFTPSTPFVPASGPSANEPSVAGEEDPGAAADDPALRDALRGEEAVAGPAPPQATP